MWIEQLAYVAVDARLGSFRRAADAATVSLLAPAIRQFRQAHQLMVAEGSASPCSPTAA